MLVFFGGYTIKECLLTKYVMDCESEVGSINYMSLINGHTNVKYTAIVTSVWGSRKRTRIQWRVNVVHGREI